MEYIQAGQMIRELRKRKGMSQEELCEGLCEPPTMSKIEKGRQYPSKKLLDALLVRLQDHVELQVPLSAEDFNRARIEREIFSRLANRDYDVSELAEQYRSCSVSMNKHEQQFYLLTLAVLHGQTGTDRKIALRELEDAIRLTIPKYKVGNVIDSAILTSVEFIILNNIAINLWFLQEKDEAIGIMEQLYNILNCYDMDREEYARRLPPVAYNLSMWLGLKESYAQSLYIAEKGIQCCIQYGKYSTLADLLYNKGFTLFCLGKNDEGRAVARKAFMLMYASGNKKSYDAFRDDMIKHFGNDVWADLKKNTLPDDME